MTPSVDLTLFETFAIRYNFCFWLTADDQNSIERWYNLVTTAMGAQDDTPYNPTNGAFALAVLSGTIEAFIRHYEQVTFPTAPSAVGLLKSITGLVNTMAPTGSAADLSLALTAAIQLLGGVEISPGFEAYPSKEGHGLYETIFAAGLTAWLLSLPGARIEGNEQEWFVVLPNSQ